MQEEAEAERAKKISRDPKAEGVFVMGGGPQDLDYIRSLWQAERSQDFSKPLEYAEASFWKDRNPANPNTASKALWPSAGKYRSTFQAMGKSIGEAAEEELDCVPDPELRLFALPVQA